MCPVAVCLSRSVVEVGCRGVENVDDGCVLLQQSSNEIPMAGPRIDGRALGSDTAHGRCSQCQWGALGGPSPLSALCGQRSASKFLPQALSRGGTKYFPCLLSKKGKKKREKQKTKHPSFLSFFYRCPPAPHSHTSFFSSVRIALLLLLLLLLIAGDRGAVPPHFARPFPPPGQPVNISKLQTDNQRPSILQVVCLHSHLHQRRRCGYPPAPALP